MRKVIASCDSNSSGAVIEPGGSGLWHGVHGDLTISNGGEPNSCAFHVCSTSNMQSGETLMRSELGMIERILRCVAHVEADRLRVQLTVCPTTKRTYLHIGCDAEMYRYSFVHGQLLSEDQ